MKLSFKVNPSCEGNLKPTAAGGAWGQQQRLPLSLSVPPGERAEGQERSERLTRFRVSRVFPAEGKSLGPLSTVLFQTCSGMQASSVLYLPASELCFLVEMTERRLLEGARPSQVSSGLWGAGRWGAGVVWTRQRPFP